MVASRGVIEATLHALNDAENSPTLSPAEKSDAIDALSTPDVRGWANGVARGGRAAEREAEALLFALVPDFHRTFDQVVIDPPRAAFSWRITGTESLGGTTLVVDGATLARFDDEGRIAEFWLYYDDAFTSGPGVEGDG